MRTQQKTICYNLQCRLRKTFSKNHVTTSKGKCIEMDLANHFNLLLKSIRKKHKFFSYFQIYPFPSTLPCNANWYSSYGNFNNIGFFKHLFSICAIISSNFIIHLSKRRSSTWDTYFFFFLEHGKHWTDYFAFIRFYHNMTLSIFFIRPVRGLIILGDDGTLSAAILSSDRPVITSLATPWSTSSVRPF